MTIKQQLFNSFVKGIGKTVGTAMVFGFIGSVLYMYSNTYLYTTKEKTNQKNRNVQADIQMSNINNDETENDNNETENDNNESETDNNELTQSANVSSSEDLENDVNSKYKHLFENLMK